MHLKKPINIIISAILIVLILLIGMYFCFPKTNLNDDFKDYCAKQLKQQIYKTSNGTEFIITHLDKEKKSNHSKVILMVSINNTEKNQDETYKWMQFTANEKKSDLKECANLVIDYAENSNWDNDYYLYISLTGIYSGCDIIYDYEKDELWIPNCENTFVKMYEKFNTFYKKDLENTQEGIDFLVNNDLAYLKHNQIEYTNIFSYTVFIDNNGEFNSFGENNSTKY